MSIPVVNMTNFFNKELFIYSIGDIRMPKPLSMRKAMLLFGALFGWTFPLVMIFGFQMNIFFWIIALSVPVLFAAVADLPFLGGRSVIQAAMVTGGFLTRDRAYADFTASSIGKGKRYTLRHEVWVSRRRELQELADMIERGE